MSLTSRKDDEDGALVEACLEHDPAAWSAFVERFSRLIFSVVGATLRRHGASCNEDVVDDLFAQTFVALYDHDHRRLRQWTGRCSLASWVRLVTASVVVDALRRRRPLLSLDEDGGRGRAIAATLVDAAPHPVARAEELERAALVRRALGDLPPADRDLLVALYNDERSAGELAVALGVRPGALYTRKNRALARLRACVEALEGDEALDGDDAVASASVLDERGAPRSSGGESSRRADARRP